MLQRKPRTLDSKHNLSSNTISSTKLQPLVGCRQKKGSSGLVVLQNKAPRWNEALNAYCLNFRGRVTQASVKNFQLAAADDLETVLLQFGKVSSDNVAITITVQISRSIKCHEERMERLRLALLGIQLKVLGFR